MPGASYPVSYSIERPERYNRWTVFFRAILIIPQLILFSGFPFRLFIPIFGNDNVAAVVILQVLSVISLSLVLAFLVFLAWFAILFSGRFPQGFLKTCLYIFRWQQNVYAYYYLLAEPYPPFADGPYDLDLSIVPTEQHNRLTVFFRFFLAIPHYIVLWALGIAAFFVTIVAWFAILFTGRYPAGMYDFTVGVARWGARVGAYALLFVDDYPPFSLSDEPGAMGLQPEPA